MTNNINSKNNDDNDDDYNNIRCTTASAIPATTSTTTSSITSTAAAMVVSSTSSPSSSPDGFRVGLVLDNVRLDDFRSPSSFVVRTNEMLIGLARIEQTLADYFASGFGVLKPSDHRAVRRGHMLAFYDSHRDLWIRARVLELLNDDDDGDGYGSDRNDRDKDPDYDEHVPTAYRLVAFDRNHLVCVNSCE